MKKITFIFLLLTVSSWVNAKTIYITDNVDINLRAGESSKSKIIATLPSGTALTYLYNRKKSGYTKVRMPNGRNAFILTSHTMDKPTNKIGLEKATVELGKLKQENDELEAELLMLRGDNTAAKTNSSNLTVEREKLMQDLEDLRYTSTHALKIKEERDSLQEKFIQTNKELEQIKLENQSLTANIELEWFLYGSSAVFFSVLFGFLLTKLSWRKKANNWDSRF